MASQVANVKGEPGLSCLFSPAKTEIDFIFVHGLGGGSRKTWSKLDSPEHYWPEKWLPQDPDFQNVGIYTFGYDSDYAQSKPNCLNIHHFGQSLLSHIETSPILGESKTHIVVIGHSMGGLVIKKAWLLAKANQVYQSIASRFAAFYFLATPHHGSDFATILRMALRLFYDREYITDLKPNSEAIKALNEEFESVAPAIELRSFYETQNMRGLPSLIVEFKSATLGYGQEKQTPMNADHRSICKFDSVSDPNYKILRNSLASTVRRLLRGTDRRDMERKLCRYLSVDESFRDDLQLARNRRSPGSCGWILRKYEFNQWRSDNTPQSRMLWVDAKPGMGKSILSSFVIDMLQDDNCTSSYYFFKASESAKCNMASCLRALAFQMALQNHLAKDVLDGIMNDGVPFRPNEARGIWRRLFASGIFQAKISPHYWIIDGLDECIDGPFLLEAILAELEPAVPLKIFVTSQEAPNLEFIRIQGPPGLLTINISAVDTLPDIKMMIEQDVASLSVVTESERDSFVQRIVDRSNGSFLWTSLVLKELRGTHLKSEIAGILEQVPHGMKPLYQRALDSLSALPREKGLVKALIAWVVCAVRPMTTQEILGALQTGLCEDVAAIDHAITSLCGQFLSIDSAGRVCLVHETACEFLMDPSLNSEFAVCPRETHTRLVETCLTYLGGRDLRPPRARRGQCAPGYNIIKTPFGRYAVEAFSHHLSRADPHSSALPSLLDKFFKANILSWIRLIAESGDLEPVLRAVEHIKAFLSGYDPKRGYPALNEWVTDLTQLTAKFSRVLVTLPGAIYGLIPPLCPANSRIRNASLQIQTLEAVGCISAKWEEVYASIKFSSGQATAICYGGDFLATGMSSGTIGLHHAASYREYRSLCHGESVRLLSVDNKQRHLVSCGQKSVKVWDLWDGSLRHTFQLAHKIMHVVFDNDLLLLVTSGNYIASWHLGSNVTRMEDLFWSDSDPPDYLPLQRVPCAVHISMTHQLLAVSYPNDPVRLWSLDSYEYLQAGNVKQKYATPFGMGGKRWSTEATSRCGVSDLLFNPNPDICLLAISYMDGNLSILNPNQDLEVAGFRANCRALSASPDGRLLIAVGCSDSVLYIYDFETLTLLFRLSSPGSFIKNVALSRSGHHLADLRASRCTIWDLSVLSPGLFGNRMKDVDSPTVEHIPNEATGVALCVAGHQSSNSVFCGKKDGKVCLYRLRSGSFDRILYSHDTAVVHMAWCEARGMLLTVDAWSRIYGYKISRNSSDAAEKVFESKLENALAIVELFVMGDGATNFIISTRESDHLWDMEGRLLESRVDGVSAVRRWMNHPSSHSHLVRVDTFDARIYRSDNWSEVARVALPTSDLLDCELGPLAHLSTADGMGTVLQFSAVDQFRTIKGLLVLGLPVASADKHSAESDFPLEKTQDITAHTLCIPTSGMAHVLGSTDRGELLYVDGESWVCSLNHTSGQVAQGPPEYTRHFFLPYNLFETAYRFASAVVDRDIVVAHGDGVVIIRKWEDYAVPAPS